MTQPPIASARPVALTAHGVSWTDEYGWLRADNWREAMRDAAALPSEIRKHLEAETAHAEARLAASGDLQERLVAEMRGRIREDDATPPAPDGPFAYYTKYREGGEHPVFCRAPREELQAEQVLLDGDALAEGRAFLEFGAVAHSPDHTWLAYTVDVEGAEQFQLMFRNLATGEEIETDATSCAGDLEWANDSQTVFFTERDDNLRPNRVWTINRKGGSPRLIYEEADPAFFIGVDKTSDNAFVLIVAHESTTSEVRVVDAADPGSTPRLIAARELDVEYDVDHWRDTFFIRTNADGAEDYKIVTAPDDAPGRTSWRDWLPAAPGVLRLGFALFADHLARLERADARPRIVVTNLADRSEHEIAFEEPAYDVRLHPGYEFETAMLRFSYSSPSTPSEIYDYDMRTRARGLVKRQEIPSGHNPSDYVVERLDAPAHDGERIPVTVLRRRETPIDGTAPLLLYGYGSYGHTISASFSGNRLSLVDRGFVYAIAHIRGGMARGYRWYREGKLLKKENTFRDYLSSAEYLCAKGYTQAGRIIAHGGSAGGLLVGAAVNMAPDLFAGVVADVPFVDVLATMLDDTLPLTPPEWTEWGNPILDRAAFETIRSYSPYDNVAEQAYPPILATAGLADPRVTYWEPAKWAARLRARASNAPTVLLHVNMDAGHAGASGRFEGLSEVARAYAFAVMAADGALGVGKAERQPKTTDTS